MEQKILNSLGVNSVQTPSRKKMPLSFVIKRYTTDINGTIILDSAVPESMAVAYPFHLFGEFDRQGGFNIADKLLSTVNNTKLFSTYIWGINSPLFFFNPLANINGKFQKGDLIFVYVDDINAPSYFSFVQVNLAGGGYGSIVSQTITPQINNSAWGAFKMFDIELSYSNDKQLDQLFYLINTTTDSRYNKNTRDPWTYYTEEIKNVKKIIINDAETIINQYTGISSLISFENPLITVSIIAYVN